MPGISVSEDEAAQLRSVLSVMVLRERTGEIGIMHGMDRFVSTHVCKKKKEIESLDAVAQRCGLAGIKRFTS